MSEDRYPLKAVREVRGHAESAAQEALAEALRDHERARGAEEAARAALKVFRDEERTRRAREKQRLLRCTAAELAREDAYSARQRAREAELSLDLARARHDASTAKAAVEEARRRLGRRSAEREVVDRHQARWRSERARADERREADELDELAARRHHE